MASKLQKSDDPNRGYVRVHSSCPALYRVVNPTKPNARRQKRRSVYHLPPPPRTDILERISRRRDDDQAPIAEMLLWLDWKMNFLIKTLTQDNDLEVFPFQALIVDLSATGAKLFGPEKLECNTWLEFQLILPTIPFQEMYLSCEVVWCSDLHPERAEGYQYEIGVEFRDIQDANREQIIRYVLNRQMELHREKKS